MSLQLQLWRVLDAVMPTFRSVDVRTFFSCFDSVNYNIATSVSFNQESVDASNDRIAKHLQSLPHFESERLRFSVNVVSIEEWKGLIDEFKSGFLEPSGARINLLRPADLMNSRGYVNSIRCLDHSPSWPSFESLLTWNAPHIEPGGVASKLQSFQYDSELILNLHASGYRELKDIFHGFLQSRADADPSYTSAIYISVPIYARIREIKFSPKESRLSTAIDCHPALCSGIQVYGERESMLRTRERIAFSAPECVDEHLLSQAALSLEDSTNSVLVSLSHRALGYITEVRKSPRELFPEEEINPLWHILQAFCPAAKFETMLTATPPSKIRDHKEQRAFERYISWLLSLNGFCPIVLGEFESLFVPPSPVQLGSVDIVAYHAGQNRILLGSCTLGPPEERDYGNLVTVRSHLVSSMDKSVSFAIDLAIFSSTAQSVAPSQYTTSKDYVALFDRDDLKESIRWLRSGIDSQFRRKLDPPPAWDSWGDISVPVES